MRKLIVLIMTSVLATGAVAQADTVNVTADPGKLIRIVELQKVPRGTDTASRSSLSVGEELKVYDNVFADGSVHYTIDLEVVDENDTLKQVAVCFYDSKAPDGTELDGTEIATTCGNGFTNVDSLAAGNPGGNEILVAAGGGAFLPQSAVQMGFIPLIINPNDAKLSVMNHATDRSRDANDDDRAHLVYSNVESGNGSLYSEQSQFNGKTIGAAGDNNVWDVSFRFVLKKFAHNSADWKIRVVATYDGATESDPDQVVELIDTETYTVGYYGDFDTVERPTQDFQNVIDGGSKEIKGINTGEYFVNFASDIFLEASAFKDSSEAALSFDGSPTISEDQVTPAVGQVSMKCVGNEPEEFMGAGTPKKLLADVPANSAEPTLGGATTRKVAPTHDCTLYIGDEVATGSYSNDVTVSIGKKDAGPPTE